MQEVSLRSYVRLVRGNANFRRLWLAQIVSELGDWLYAVAVYSLLLEYTGSAKAVATAFVLQTLPQFFVSPAAGILNDRLRRKQVMIAADCLRAAVVFGMLFMRQPSLVWLMYLLLFLETVLWAFFEPGRNAVIPNIVQPEEVAAANALSSTTWSFNFVMGFAVGGVLAAYFGRDVVFVLNTLSFVFSAGLIARMRFAEPHAENKPPFRVAELFDFQPIRDGMAYVWKSSNLRYTIFVKAGLGLMATNWVLLPILGERVFRIYHFGFSKAGFSQDKAGMLGMSLLMASRGVGAILGPLLAVSWAVNSQHRMRWGILIAFVAGGIGYLGLSVSQTVWVASMAIVLAHAGGAVLWVFSATLLQLGTEDSLRGRVFSADFAFMVVVMSISSYLAGVLIDDGFTVASVAAGTGCAMLAAGTAWWLTLRSA